MNIKLNRWALVYFGFVWLAVSAAAQTIQPICFFTNVPPSNPGNLLTDLTPGPDGNFYGMTQNGGSSYDGTVFRVTTNGAFTVIANFDSSDTGESSYSALTLGPDGNFYGTTSFAGPRGAGTVFRVTPSGSLNVLFSFRPATWNGSILTNADGAMPYGGLTFGQDGCFYGTTTEGGTNGGGTGFRITTNGTLTTIANFGPPNGSADTSVPGGSPQATLTLGPDGNFYGTTYLGGYQGNGTVFRMATNGALTTLVRFADTNGSEPNSTLLLGPDQAFYGTTLNGGSGADGTVFRITTNGMLTTFVPFDSTTVNTPEGNLKLGPDGYFYGTLAEGSFATNGGGGVFRASTNGALTILATFGGTNGYEPESGLTMGPDGNFYGTTFRGGPDPNASGVIYRLNLGSTATNAPLGITMNADGTVSLNLASTTSSTNRLWATTNPSLPMAQWQLLATNVATNGIVQFTDPNPSGSQIKFYRLSTP